MQQLTSDTAAGVMPRTQDLFRQERERRGKSWLLLTRWRGEDQAPETVPTSCHFPICGHNIVMRKTKKAYAYQIHLIPQKEGGYTVLVPLLPGCVSYGKTIEEATEHAREAIELHLENLAAHKEPIPEGNETVCVFTTFIQVTPSHV